MRWAVQYLLGQELGGPDELNRAIGPRSRGRYRSHHEWCVGQQKSQNNERDGQDESRLEVFHRGGQTSLGCRTMRGQEPADGCAEAPGGVFRLLIKPRVMIGSIRLHWFHHHSTHGKAAELLAISSSMWLSLCNRPTRSLAGHPCRIQVPVLVLLV